MVKRTKRVTKSKAPPARKVVVKPKPKERKPMSVFKKDKWIDTKPTTERERGGGADNAVREGADHPDPGAERSEPVDLNKLEEAIADPLKPQTVELQAALAVLVDAVMAGRTASAPAARRGGKASRETREGEEPVTPAEALEWHDPLDERVRQQAYLQRVVDSPIENSLRASIRLIGHELHQRGGIALMEQSLLAIWNEDQARRAVVDLTWNGLSGDWWATKNYEVPAA